MTFETDIINDIYKIINSNFFNNGPMVAFIWKNDKFWSVEAVSKNVESIFGYSIEDFMNKKILYSNIIHPEDLQKVSQEVSFYSNENLPSFEHSTYRIKNSKNEYRWIKDSTTIIYSQNGEITHFIGYIFDCTTEIQNIKELKEKEIELQKTQKELFTSRQMWINAIESNGDGLWEWDLTQNSVFFSKQWKKMLGYDENDIGNSLSEWEKRVHKDDLQKVCEDINNYLNGKTKTYENEHRVLCKDGSYKWILDRGAITQYSSDNRPLKMTGTHCDINEKKELLNKLNNHKLRFEKMFREHDSIMLLIHPENGKIIDANKSACLFYGYDHKEFLNMTIDDINLLSKTEIQKKMEEAKIHKHNQFDFPHRLKNNQIKNVKVHSTPIETEEGTILFSIIEDITKIKEYHKQIEVEKTKLQTIIHTIPDLLWIKDLNGKYILCNKRFEDLYNTKIENIIGKTDYDFVNKDLADFFRKYDKLALTSNNNVSSFKEMQFSSDGHKEYVHTTKTKILDKDGNVLGILGIGRDTTTIKQYQDELEKQHNFIETILNMQPTMILLTNGEKVIFVNHTLLDFYKCKNLYEFINNFGCICNTFIKNDIFFHLGKVSEKKHWVEEINKLPKEYRLVSIKSFDDGENKIFRLVSKNYNENFHIITLNDVTETINKQFELEDKNIHDKLTNSYNREFFENNIKSILYDNKQNRVETAIVMIDIDYFKRVNDNFGHDVGDIVLKELVNLMRLKSRDLKDLLIRWGGEEFLMVLPVKDMEYLYSTLEKYRMIIQEHNFSIVKKITCSFGSTLYITNENVNDAIKRADIALYESKAKGRNQVTLLI